MEIRTDIEGKAWLSADTARGDRLFMRVDNIGAIGHTYRNGQRLRDACEVILRGSDKGAALDASVKEVSKLLFDGAADCT